jgi:SAM-dependent methyltransferase
MNDAPFLAPETAPAAPSPYEAPDLYDMIFEDLAFDLPFWRAVAGSAGGPVLEVGCGTGRILLRLLAQGVDAEGIDAHPPMLERLREKARQRGLAARVTLADMRSFALPRRYARVLCAFNTFAHCATVDEQLAALGCMREHLEPDGALVLHMSYPSASLWLGPDGDPVFEVASPHPLNDHRLEMWDTRYKDIVGQSQRSVMEVREVDAAGRTVETQRLATTQRWVYRYELELLLRLAGFAGWQVFGGFEGEPLENDQQQMVVWAWRGATSPAMGAPGEAKA